MSLQKLKQKMPKSEFMIYLHGNIDAIGRRMPAIASEMDHWEFMMGELRHIYNIEILVEGGK